MQEQNRKYRAGPPEKSLLWDSWMFLLECSAQVSGMEMFGSIFSIPPWRLMLREVFFIWWQVWSGEKRTLWFRIFILKNLGYRVCQGIWLNEQDGYVQVTFDHLWSIFEAAVAVANIGSSVKPNQHKNLIEMILI